MHGSSYNFMDSHLNRISIKGAKVLDVGSFDVNGTYKPLVVARGWEYTGLDLVEGPNVDVVSSDPYEYPFDDDTFDVVISGSTMEHVEAIWFWVAELVRVLKPGGLLVIVAPHTWGIHSHPVDCWRILPDGIRFLFDYVRGLENYEIVAGSTDTAASAFKSPAKVSRKSGK